jgi:plasmid stabilization system protein ParE
MKPIIWSPSAATDFEELLAYIAAQNPQAAKLVQGRVLKAIDLLETFQFGLAGPIPGTYRHYIPKTSYFVVYRNLPKTVEIAAFCHASTDWLNRDQD